jgi:hypothetical protein
MAIDARIPLGVVAPKLDSIPDIQARGMQMRALSRADQAATREESERKTIRDLYRSSVGEDGQLDATGFDRGVAAAGLGDRLPEIQKDRASLEQARATTQASQFKLAKDRLDGINASLSSLLARPNVTHQDVLGQLNQMVSSGIINQEQGAKMYRELPPEQHLRSYLLQQGLQSADASKRLEALLPKYDEQDTGGEIVERTIDPLTGRPTEQRRVAKSATPGERLTDARNREEIAMGGKPPPGYRWTPQGTLQAIPGGPGDKLPEAQQKQVVGVQNLQGAIGEYLDQLKTWGGTDIARPDARAAMGTKYNNMMLQAKEAYNLGVLNGPDLEILTSVITDPRSMAGAVTSNEALANQAKELNRIMGSIASVSGNRRPQDVPPLGEITATGTNGEKIVLRNGQWVPQ